MYFAFFVVEKLESRKGRKERKGSRRGKWEGEAGRGLGERLGEKLGEKRVGSFADVERKMV